VLDILQAKRQLDIARKNGDPLLIDLAEDALNNLLDRYHEGVFPNVHNV
jgi:hypothetical protein